MAPALAATAPSDDAPTKSLCSGSRTYTKATNTGVAFQQAGGDYSSVTGGPGVHLSISTTRTFTVSGTITSTAEVSADAVIASVKSGVGVSIGKSQSGTTTNSGLWVVPSNYKIGRLAIGSMKYRGTVTKYLENSNCVAVKLGSSASYNAPKREWHFQTTRVS